MMGSTTCSECGSIFTFDVYPRRGAVCFKCHVGSVRLGFSHGKEDFHGPTIKERQDHQVAQAKAAGINAEPVGNRWV
jgi:ferric-dicitrate binding protein FerR (iron transport regulator)